MKENILKKSKEMFFKSCSKKKLLLAITSESRWRCLWGCLVSFILVFCLLIIFLSLGGSFLEIRKDKSDFYDRIQNDDCIKVKNEEKYKSIIEPYIVQEFGYKYAEKDNIKNKKYIPVLKKYKIYIGDYTLQENSTAAKKVLWNFLIEELTKNRTDKNISELINDLNIKEEYTWAVFVDLNDDGAKDVIGFNQSTFYMGTQSGSFYVLISRSGSYVDYGFDLINTDVKEICILETKTNGFYDIEFVGSNSKNKDKRILQYEKI